MSYLEDLKKICAEMTEVASDKASIDKMAEMSVVINKIEEENTKLLKNYDELKGAYKDAILHNPYGENRPSNDIGDTKPVSFEDCLAKFMSEQGKK